MIKCLHWEGSVRIKSARKKQFIYLESLEDILKNSLTIDAIFGMYARNTETEQGINIQQHTLLEIEKSNR